VASAAPVKNPTLVLTSAPPGAAVFLGRTSLGQTPLTTDQLAAEARQVLRIEKRGFEPYELEVQLGAGERREQSVKLVAVKGGRRGHRGRGRAAATTSPAPAVAAVGFITVKTKPWTKVTLGGKRLGDTPLHKVELAPGSHTLRMVNEKEGIDVTRKIVVKANETTKLNLDLK